MILAVKTYTFNRIKFILSLVKLKNFLKKNIHSYNEFLNDKVGRSYVIILSPWSLTATPWFSIVLGLILHKRNNKVKFLIDDLQCENRIDHLLQINLIRIAIRSLIKCGFIIESLSDFYAIKTIDLNEKIGINKLAFANAVHKNKGEENTLYFDSLCDKNNIILSRHFLFVKSYIEENCGFTYIFPGGICGNSGLFEFVLRTKFSSFFTFDSGFGVLLSTFNGIAAQFTDIPNSLELLLAGNESEKCMAINAAKVEFEKRKNGTNKLNSQYHSFELSENFEEVGILIPLNSPWDSAALNIASVFTHYNEWLIETVGLILENSNFKITIRQHPDERYWWGKSKTDFSDLLMNKYSDSRIQFVSCFDNINSYALLNKCSAVMCYSSTFGIEAAMAGKKVCVCSNVYYSRLGFSFRPSNIEDIIFFLKNIESIEVLSENAFLTYYLGQKCNWLFTSFNPMMSDFNKWVTLGFDDLLVDVDIKIYIESLERHLPLSFVNHNKNNE